LTATQASIASSTASTKTSSGVTISVDATIAAATKADAKKEPADLIADIRETLDAQYDKKGKGAKADLSAMSPRAVATIALNSDGSFSKAEVLAAKAEMRTRDRATFLSATASDFSLTSLQAYQNARLTSYGTMSAEERAVRGNKS
jgi:hypothetical protein